MLSSFASFLPSALHLNAPQELPRPAINPDTEDEDEPEVNPPPQNAESGQQAGKGKDKDKTANEVRFYLHVVVPLASRQSGVVEPLIRSSDARLLCTWSDDMNIRTGTCQS
jgi:hypothetical protein